MYGQEEYDGEMGEEMEYGDEDEMDQGEDDYDD